MLSLSKFKIIIPIFIGISGKYIIGNFLIKIFFNCGATIRHNFLSLILAKIKIHAKRLHQFVDKVLNTFHWLW